MMRRALAAVLLGIWPTIAQADVLTEDNRELLCTRSYDGKAAVNTDTLAMLIVTSAGGAMFLDGANQAGLRDGSIQLRSSGSSLSEPAYAVVHAGRASPSDGKHPFGPDVDLTTNKAAAAASDAIAEELSDLGFLTEDNVHEVGKVTFRILRPAVVGSRLARTEAGDPLALFGDAGLVVVCEVRPATVAENEGDDASPSGETSPSTMSVRPVLRGSVKDLSVAAEDLKDAEAASIAYSEDNIADTTTFALNAVAGLRIGSRSGSFEVIPYLSYERKAITGDDGDIEKFSPGIVGAWRLETPEFGIHARVEASFIDDIQQGSHQGKVRVYVDPAIWLGTGNGVLFGGNLPQFRPLMFRPRLTLIADLSKIHRAGANEELADADDYWGLGGDLSLRARLDIGSPISDFVLTGGVRHLELGGEIDLNHARRWYGSLEYAPEAFPYVGLALEFNDGLNDDTFQREDTYSLTLRLRH